jgi:hypothetical protein
MLVVYEDWIWAMRLVMLLCLLVSDSRKGKANGQTYKSKKENWLGWLPYWYTNREAK